MTRPPRTSFGPVSLTEPVESDPAALLRDAAGLLDQHGHASSECRKAAERLRHLARLLARAARGSR